MSNIGTSGLAQARGVADVDWSRVYASLNVSLPTAYRASSVYQWNIPVPRALSVNAIVSRLRAKGVLVRLPTLKVNFDDSSRFVHLRSARSSGYSVSCARALQACDGHGVSCVSWSKDHTDISLSEYLLLYWGYFLTTDKALDTDLCTLCGGTRVDGSKVAVVGFYDGGLQIDFVDRDRSRQLWGHREVVLWQ